MELKPQQQMYANTRFEDIQWTYGREQLPPLLAGTSVTLHMWQSTHDAVARIYKKIIQAGNELMSPGTLCCMCFAMGNIIQANQEIQQAWGNVLHQEGPIYKELGVHVTLATELMGTGVGSHRHLRKEVVGLRFEAAGATPSHTTDVSSQIAKLHELREKGALTEKEYQEAKQKLLAAM